MFMLDPREMLGVALRHAPAGQIRALRWERESRLMHGNTSPFLQMSRVWTTRCLCVSPKEPRLRKLCAMGNFLGNASMSYRAIVRLLRLIGFTGFLSELLSGGRSIRRPLFERNSGCQGLDGRAAEHAARGVVSPSEARTLAQPATLTGEPVYAHRDYSPQDGRGRVA